MTWSKKIALLKRLIEQVGSLWPRSTKLAGYAEAGPYFCGMCEYLKRDENGNPVKFLEGKGRCNQEVMIVDPETKKSNGLAIVNIERGCCEFVEPFKRK
jgi:hypothetical protein